MGVAPGCLITFEGIDGSGKSTQIKKIYNFLNNKKIKCIKTREPGGTILSEKIRKIIINDIKNNEDNLTELLLLFAARSNHFKKIKQYIKKGYIVLCDRYIDSTYVYQHYEQKQNLKLINYIQNEIDDGLKPKITFLMDIPINLSKYRISKRGKRDRFDKYNKSKLIKLRNSYIKLSNLFSRIIKIDGTQNEKKIKSTIINHLIRKNVIKNI